MELPELSVSSTSVSLFLFLFFLYKLLKGAKCRKPKAQNLPPGPRKLPLIGSMHHLVGGLPHRLLGDLSKKYGPIMHLQLGEVPAVVITSPQLAKEVMKTHDIVFANRPRILGSQTVLYDGLDIVFAPYGDYWRQLRKICTMELLSAKNVRAFAPIRKSEVSHLISSIRSSSSAGLPINISEGALSYTSSVVSRAAFGRAANGQEALLSTIKQLLVLMGGFDVSDIFPSIKWLHFVCGMKPKMLKFHKKMDGYFDNIVNVHIKNRMATNKGYGESGEEDLVDVLLRVKENGDLDIPLSMDSIKAVILDMFVAGTETSSTVVEWVMAELIKNPRVMEKVQNEVRQAFKGKAEILENDIQELKYMKLVVKETLRLHPPVPMLAPRENIEESKIGGYDIEAKTKVMINIWAIGRDPRYWKDAHKFEPERFETNSVDFTGNNFEFIPFGAGRRMCPGVSFGLANVELPLAQLLYHFDWKLPDGMTPEKVDMRESQGMTATKKRNLYLIATPYNY